jgi:hypothetical protein
LRDICWSIPVMREAANICVSARDNAIWQALINQDVRDGSSDGSEWLSTKA